MTRREILAECMMVIKRLIETNDEAEVQELALELKHLAGRLKPANLAGFFR
jgi:hypothetical protein